MLVLLLTRQEIRTDIYSQTETFEQLVVMSMQYVWSHNNKYIYFQLYISLKAYFMSTGFSQAYHYSHFAFSL